MGQLAVFGNVPLPAVARCQRVNEAHRLGISATPTFLVGMMDGGQLKGARVIRGAQPYASIKAIIDERLSPTK